MTTAFRQMKLKFMKSSVSIFMYSDWLRLIGELFAGLSVQTSESFVPFEFDLGESA